MFKIFGKSTKPMKYSSAPTRFSTLDSFTNGAMIKETFPTMSLFPGEMPNELYNSNIRSGQSRHQEMPSSFGYNGIRNIGGVVIDSDKEAREWLRNKGEW